MSKINFYVNFDEDAEYCFSRLFKGKDPAGIEKRLEAKGIDKSFYKNVLNETNEDRRKEMFMEYLKIIYKEKSILFKKIAEKYNFIWRDKQELFFELIEKRTGIRWKYDVYNFFVSAFYSRASWGGKGFAVWYKRKPERYFHLNGYELALSHHFEVVDSLFPKNRPVENIKIWALAEIAAWFLTYEDKEIVEQCFPHLLGKEIGMKSYPQLIPVMDKLRDSFKKNNYIDWTQEGLDLIKDYSIDYLFNSKQ